MKQSSIFVTLVACVVCACANDPAPPRSGPSDAQESSSTEEASIDTSPTDSDLKDTDADQDNDTPDVVLSYPPGPYGVKPGSIIADITWQGWRNPVAVGHDPEKFETISLSDYYDAAGEKGYRAIVLNASARWCSICKLEQSHLRAQRDKWQSKGVVFIGSLFEGTTADPAKASDLVAWSRTYQIDWVLVLDPNNQLGLFFDRAASPMNMVIDTRTMKIRDIVTGLPEDAWWEKQLGPLTEVAQ